MRKILLSVLMVAVVGGVTIAATRAYFTSQSILGASTLASGTLTVGATSNNHSYLDLGTIKPLAPGDVTDWITITVKNNGNLNATTFGKFDLSNDTGLASALKLYDYQVKYFKADNSAVQRWATHDNYYGTDVNEDYFIKDGDSGGKWAAIGASTNLTEWTNVVGHGAEDVPPRSWDFEGTKAGYSYVIRFRLQMDPAADNTYQGKSCKLGYEVLATQVEPNALAAMSGATGIDAGTLSNDSWGVYGQSLNQVNTY